MRWQNLNEYLFTDLTIELSERVKLAELRENRDEKKVAELSAKTENAAQGTENLMPLFIEAVESDMALGEIANILRDVWGGVCGGGVLGQREKYGVVNSCLFAQKSTNCLLTCAFF